MSAVDCLDDIIRTEAPRIAFACLESALNRGIIRPSDATTLVARSPAKIRPLLCGVSRKSESGTESMMSFDLRRAGIPFRQQVKFPGVARVDFLVGARLVIEADGAEFHATVDAFESDRDRDAKLSALGYRVLRFSYRQLSVTPGLVMRAIVAAIARGDCE